MGRFESNALAPRHRHHPPRDSLDLDGRLSGSLAAFKFAISAHFKKIRSDSFRKDFAPRPILLFQKMRGWLRATSPTALPIRSPATGDTKEIEPDLGSASSSPTIRYFCTRPSSRLNVTVLPKATVSVDVGSAMT